MGPFEINCSKIQQQVGNYTVTSLTLGRYANLPSIRISVVIFYSGSYATVNLAYTLKVVKGLPTLLYQQVACKMIRLGGGIRVDKLMREVEILRGLDHVRKYCLSLLTQM